MRNHGSCWVPTILNVCALSIRAEKLSYEYNRAVPRVLLIVATPGKAKHNDRSDAWRQQ